MKVVFRYSERIVQQIIRYFLKHQHKDVDLIMPRKYGQIEKIDKQFLEQTLFKIKNKWVKIEKKFLKKVRELGLKLQPEFICYVSKFGTAGFYIPPNKLVIRVASKTDLKESNINIAHELMHLILGYNKKDGNLNYIAREKKVDDILTSKNFIRSLPDYKRQKF